jgi:thioesterase domain-containing protein
LCVAWSTPQWGWSQDARDEAEYARQLPAEAKQHVYLFFLNGLDPLEFGQLSGLRDYCRDLGFNKSWYGQFYHRWYFQRVIEDVWQRDPEARFVIVGFSAGALAARDMANALHRENIPVALLVYIGGATLTNSPRNRPENVGRVIHVRANDPIFRGWAIEGADNVKCQDVWHFGTPLHPETRRRLAEALAEIAGQIPVVQPPAGVWRPAATSGVPSRPTDAQSLQADTNPIHLTSQASTHPQAQTPSSPARDPLPSDWDFLRATRQLRPVPSPDYSGLPLYEK